MKSANSNTALFSVNYIVSEEYKVNLIGEQDLRKLTKEELELLVAAFVKAMSIEKCNHDKDK